LPRIVKPKDLLATQKEMGLARQLMLFVLEDPEPMLWCGEPILSSHQTSQQNQPKNHSPGFVSRYSVIALYRAATERCAASSRVNVVSGMTAALQAVSSPAEVFGRVEQDLGLLLA
jgi:hypothetical protein